MEFDINFEDFLADDYGAGQPIAPNLFANINWEKEVAEELRLLPDSMFEWDLLFGKENLQAAKKRKTSESMEPLKQSNRFGKPTSVEELEAAAKGFVPVATKASTSWAVRNFCAWRSWRMEAKPDDPVPADLLERCDASELNTWLQAYVYETRREDGKPFPSKSIDSLLAGLKRYMQEQQSDPPNILSEDDPRFKGLRGVRDNVARARREEGIGAQVQHVQPFSIEEEERLWDLNIMGVHSPKALFNAVFFANGKNLCLRGGREHHNLKLSQFEFGSVDKNGKSLNFVCYTEFGSKNRSGSYRDKADNKVVEHFADESLGEKCFVHLLQLYCSKLPPDAFQKGSFYWHAKQKTPLDNSPWFTSSRCGRNHLSGVVKQMCTDGEIEEKTNHSLRVTGATRMFNAQVPEKIIQERTGHRSLDALRAYQRTSISQQKAVSSILASANPPLFSDKLEKVAPVTAETDTESSAPGPSGMNLQACQNCTINVHFHA